jgi:hypothetical protein
MEIKITHSLSPETAQLLTDLINVLRPAHANPDNKVPAAAPQAPKNYLPFTEPDIVPAKPPKASEAPQAPAEGVDIATIRSLVKDKADAGLKSEIKELLTEHGAANVSQLKPSAYAAFFAQLQTL